MDGIRSRAVRRSLAHRRRQHPARVGTDETSFQKRHEDVTVGVDQQRRGRQRGTVLYGADRKGRASIDLFFKGPGKEACARIQSVAIDFSPAYLGSALQPTNADICIDRFHGVQLLYAAVDQVRRAEHKALLKQGDETLKGTRYDWLMTEQRMSPLRQK